MWERQRKQGADPPRRGRQPGRVCAPAETGGAGGATTGLTRRTWQVRLGQDPREPGIDQCEKKQPTEQNAHPLKVMNRDDLRMRVEDQGQDAQPIHQKGHRGSDSDEQYRVCEEYEATIRHGVEDAHRGVNRAGKGINVVMVNSEAMADAESYIMCLVEYGEERTIVRPELPAAAARLPTTSCSLVLPAWERPRWPVFWPKL